MHDIRTIKELNDIVVANRQRVADQRAREGVSPGQRVGYHPWVPVAYGDGTWRGENLSTGSKLVRRGSQVEAIADIEAAIRLQVSYGE